MTTDKKFGRLSTVTERNPGIAYAEDNLGVHTVYAEAKDAEARLQHEQASLHEARTRKAIVTEQIADREAQIVSDERGANPDMAQTAMDKHLKVLFRTDTRLTELRSNVQTVNAVIDQHEGNVRLLEMTIRLRIARLGELGGYLTFLGALKDNETARNSGTLCPPGSPW